MNQKNLLCGSSETTRETPFNFDLFYKFGHAKHVPRISEDFLEWFLGFYEGDGSIYNAKTSYTKLRFSFRILQKEKQIIQKLHYTFGYGNISSEIKENGIYWRWTLESKQTIESIAYLLHGNLVWPEHQDRYMQWIQAGQKQGLFQNLSLNQLTWPSPKSCISLQNGWLSGFIDAEGCFYAHLKETINPKTGAISIQLNQKMTLTQKFHFDATQRHTFELYDQPEKFIFDQFLDIFNSAAQIRVFSNHQNKKTIYGRVEIGSLSSQKLIVDYLQLYKLRTQKYIAYRRWWRVWLRRKAKIHLTVKGRKRLYRLIANINNSDMSLKKKYKQKK